MDIPPLSIHQVGGHLGCFYLLTLMNNAVTNIHRQVLCGYEFSILLGTCLGIEFLDHMVLCLYEAMVFDG